MALNHDLIALENVKIAVSVGVVRATLSQDETVRSAIEQIQQNPQEAQAIHAQLLRLLDNPASHDEAIAAHLLVLEAANSDLVFKPAEFVALKTSLQWAKPLALDILNRAIDWDDDEDSSPLDTYKASEEVLKRDWDTPEEDEAWSNL